LIGKASVDLPTFGAIMSHRYERYNERPRRSGLRCLFVGLTIVVWVVVLGFILVRFVARPMLTNLIGDRIAEPVSVDRPQSDIEVPMPSENFLPPIPPGSYTITEADANQWFTANRDQLQGVDDVRLRFVPGEAQADLTIRGVTGTARAGIEVVDGRVAVTDARLDPPLGWAIDIAPVATLLQNQINNNLASTNQRVTNAVVEAGQVILTVE
jgi:hypothetical protein